MSRLSQPRILTFNFHEPYMVLMSKTGLEMDLGLYTEGILARRWKTEFRPKPENLHEIPEPEWRERLKNRYYDIVIAHNEMNAWDVRDAPCSKVIVCHNRKSFLKTILPKDQPFAVSDFEKMIEILKERFVFVFISNSKQDDYGIEGHVIIPGIDIEDYGGYTGDDPCILRVGNYMENRNWMFDVPFQETVCKGLRNVVIGENPSIPHSRPSKDFEDLLTQYRKNRCLFHVTRQEFEDGYNLSMLEAMACGMPVVSLANYTSPITNGMDGFTSFDPAQLRKYLELLLEDRNLAQEIGSRGRETVAKRFPIQNFVENWRSIIFHYTGFEQTSIHIRKPNVESHRYRILLDYISSPHTTGRYFEYALEQKHDVVTTGYRVPEELLNNWGFTNPPPYPPQRIPVSIDNMRFYQMFSGVPFGYGFDFYLYVDSGLKYMDASISKINIPKVAYFIDTHLDLKSRLEMAKYFDIVFLAQQSHVEVFKKAGIQNVFWLPLAYYPELYPRDELARDIDISYVGSLSPEEGDKRRKLLSKVAQVFPNHFIGKSWPLDMATIYSRSKIVVNCCINYDLNMRVFEALGSGALLITDPADSLLELFEDGKDLVVYHNEEDLLEKIHYYLTHEEERMTIARQGKQKAINNHTYHHRVETMLDVVDRFFQISKPSYVRLELKPINYYTSSRPELLPYIPSKVKKVLDVGCGAGNFGANLKKTFNIEKVVGVEVVPDVAHMARNNLDEVVVGNIEEIELPFEKEYFDLITCCDVLEHLIDPLKTLRKLKEYVKPFGYILISIPNIKYWGVLQELCEGEFSYMDSGILDITHLHFFTRDTLKQFLRKAGLITIGVFNLNLVPEYIVPRSSNGDVQLGKLLIKNVSDEEYAELRTFQWVALAQRLSSDLQKVDELIKELLNEGKLELVQEIAYSESTELPLWKRKTIEGKVHAWSGNLIKAQEAYLSALQLEENEWICLEYALLLIAMNQANQAVEYLQKAERSLPNHPKVRIARAQIDIQMGRFMEAFSQLHDVLSSSYEYYEALPLFALTCEMLNRLHFAEDMYQRFMEFYPGNIKITVEYARFLGKHGQINTAIQVLDEYQMLFGENELIAQELQQLKSRINA